MNAAVPPLSGTRPDGQIMCEIMQRFGYPQEDYTPDGVLAEIARIVPFFKGATWEGLGENGKQWPIAANGEGTHIMHTEKFSRGLGKFHFFKWIESNELVTNGREFPFILTTGRLLEHYNCGTMTRRTGNSQIVTEDVLTIHPDDAGLKDISTGEKVRLFSARGEVILHAQRIREEVVEHLSAPPVKPGKKDLLLMPNHLMLTIHESVAHPTELDRALGYEANYAGTSYITPTRSASASPANTAPSSATAPRRARSPPCGYDDEGVKATQWTIIDKGIFKSYQTTREQAHFVGEKESHGCSQADSWATVPFQRMPNVWLKAGPRETTLESLISGIDNGVLIDGRGSYSIDQQRYNIQFGGDAFWEIKGGKKRGMISRVSYQARTPDFWQACDGTAGPAYWRQYGTTGDAKGEPTQINSISHGCAPTRFRGINVILTD